MKERRYTLSSATIPRKLPEAIDYAKNYPLDAEVLEYKVKDGGPVKTGVGYYPYKDSYVMAKARKL